MKHLESYNDYLPKDEEVKEVEEYLRSNFEIKDATVLGKPVKYILLDDKIYHIKGSFSNKELLKLKMYNYIKDDLTQSEASIKRAIKNFITFQ